MHRNSHHKLSVISNNTKPDVGLSYLMLKTALSLSLFVWKRDGRRDSQTAGDYYSGLHCEQCGPL